MDAIDHAGVVGLLIAFAVTFGFRLIFWSKIPSSMQAIARSVLQFIMVALVIATIAGAVYVGGRSGTGGTLPLIFLTFAVVSQVATLIWLVKYRRE